MKKRFSILRIIGLLLLISAVLVIASVAWDLHSYLQDTPRITPYEDVTITAGQTVTPDDLALIEKSHGTVIRDVRWESGSVKGIVPEEDGSSFTVTEGEGILEVLIFAKKGESGENAYKTARVLVEN